MSEIDKLVEMEEARPTCSERDLRATKVRIRSEYLSDENISRVAHQQWVNEGCPDGEQPDPHFHFRGWKIKERHWLVGELHMTALFEIDWPILAHGYVHGLFR